MNLDMGGEEIVVLTAGRKPDPKAGAGQTKEDWSTPVERAVTTITPLVPFQLEPAGEPVQDLRNSLTHGWVLYLPPGDAIAATDRVRVRGEVFPVQGAPARWDHSTIANAYVTEG